MIPVEDLEASYVKGSRLQIKEVVVRKCLSKLVFLKFSKFQTKNTCAAVSFYFFSNVHIKWIGQYI